MHVCEQIHNAISRVFAIAWKFSSFMRTYESQLGMIVGEAAWVRDLWREHDAALRELVSKLQLVRSDQGRSMREFSKVRLVSFLTDNGRHVWHSTDRSLGGTRLCFRLACDAASSHPPQLQRVLPSAPGRRVASEKIALPANRTNRKRARLIQTYCNVILFTRARSRSETLRLSRREGYTTHRLASHFLLLVFLGTDRRGSLASRGVP